jgi:hypothetical protein
VAKSFSGRVERALGLFGVIAIGVTVAVVTKWNPWPGIRDYVHNHRATLSEPHTAWSQTASGQPSSVAITGTAVVAFMGDLVESRSRGDGSLLWRKEVKWGALAGAPTDRTASVILGKPNGGGFDAVDPQGGQQRWSDTGANGAWTFRDAVLAVQCDKSGCAITNRAPADGATRWQITVSGTIHARAGVNDGLLNPRSLDNTFDAATAASPRPMPRYLAFLQDHRVQIIDTAAAKRVREEDVPLDAQSVVVANRTVRASAATRNGGCRYQVTGRDAGSGAQVWRNDGYDLGTTGGVGCEPRREPAGAGTVLVATRGDNRPVFMSAVDGRDLAVAGPDETILGTDGEYGLIRSADRKKIRAVSLTRGGATAWTRDAPTTARVGLTPYAIFIADAEGATITALDPATGQVKLNLASTAAVLGVHADGVVLGHGRTVGFIGFGAVA